jgi:hypothetical protein
MAKIPEQKRLTQLVLFGAQSETPHWRDLAEATRVEAISILAQLLRSLHSCKQNRAPQLRGGRDD